MGFSLLLSPDAPLPEKATHDYQRKGTATLLAALEIASGKVTDRCVSATARPSFRLPQDRRSGLPRRQLHVVCDNYRTHKHEDFNAWLVKNPRVKPHFTATSGSWLNLVGVFFSIIARQEIRRGSFHSVKELMTAISAFIDGWNQRCNPFTWTKTADEIQPHARKQTSAAGH